MPPVLAGSRIGVEHAAQRKTSHERTCVSIRKEWRGAIPRMHIGVGSGSITRFPTDKSDFPKRIFYFLDSVRSFQPTASMHAALRVERASNPFPSEEQLSHAR